MRMPTIGDAFISTACSCWTLDLACAGGPRGAAGGRGGPRRAAEGRRGRRSRQSLEGREGGSHSQDNAIPDPTPAQKYQYTDKKRILRGEKGEKKGYFKISERCEAPLKKIAK